MLTDIQIPDTLTVMIKPLAQDYTAVFESETPDILYTGSPGIAVTPENDIVTSFDLRGPGAEQLPGVKWKMPNGGVWQGRVYISRDRGMNWEHRVSFPFIHARPFIAGDKIYIIGHGGDLKIIRSDDGGRSWTEPRTLTANQFWHQAPCNVITRNGCIYLVMERRVSNRIKYWYPGELAPVLMRGRIGTDLTRKKNWTFASELPFFEALPGTERDPEIDYFGVPFYECPYPEGSYPAPDRACAPMGWLETNVVQITDPSHYWNDPEGKTFHLWARTHTGGTGYAAVAAVKESGREAGTGSMKTFLQKNPSGKTCLFVPCPGGHMKFHILQDGTTGLYWLLSTQATDSMSRAETLGPDRYNLPNNQRRRLQLHFSRNMIDWCFAGLVAAGPSENAARHYASMAVQDDDLIILSRSGNERAKNAHDGNLVSFHRIPDFRSLAY
jgi:hypothetical protein